MKKLLSIIILGLFFVVLGCEKDSLFDTTVDNDTKVSVRASDLEIEDMINGGVFWLLEQQNPDGSFSGGNEVVARTAMAVVKLCDYSIENGCWPNQGGYGSDMFSGGKRFFREYSLLGSRCWAFGAREIWNWPLIWNRDLGI